MTSRSGNFSRTQCYCLKAHVQVQPLVCEMSFIAVLCVSGSTAGTRVVGSLGALVSLNLESRLTHLVFMTRAL